MNNEKYNDLFYVCALIEYLGRKTKNHRSYVVEKLGVDGIERQLKDAGVNHLYIQHTKFIVDSIHDKTVETLVMRHSIDSGSSVLILAFESDVYAAFESGFRCVSVGFAVFKIGVHSVMKVCDKFSCGGSFIGDKGSDTLYFSVKNAIRLRKLNASDIALVFDDVVHIRPSSSR